MRIKLKVLGLSLVALFVFGMTLPSCDKKKDDINVEQQNEQKKKEEEERKRKEEEERKRKEEEERKRKEEEERKRKEEEERKRKEEEARKQEPMLKLDGKMVEFSGDQLAQHIWDWVNSPNEFKFKADRLTIIDFNAVWCAPCKGLKPHLEQHAANNKDQVYVIGIDTDKNPKVWETAATLFNKVNNRFGVGIPAMILVSRDGKTVKTLVGYNKKVIEELKQFVEEYK